MCHGLSASGSHSFLPSCCLFAQLSEPQSDKPEWRFAAIVNRDLRHGRSNVEVPNGQGEDLFSVMYAGHDCWTYCCEETSTTLSTDSCYVTYLVRVCCSQGCTLAPHCMLDKNELATTSYARAKRWRRCRTQTRGRSCATCGTKPHAGETVGERTKRRPS